MKYEDMLLFLSDHSVEELSLKLTIPVQTVYRFLEKHGYQHPVQVQVIEKVEKRLRINSLDIYGKEYTGNQNSPTDLQRQIIIGTLFGDSGLYWSTKDKTAFFKCEHCWGQIGYCKAKIELLKPFSFSPYIDKPTTGGGYQDYQVGFSCHASEYFADLRNVFYNQAVSGSPHLQKDILQLSLWEQQLTPISLAFWVMDDGKKNGSAFCISIGKQLGHPEMNKLYTYERLDSCVYGLNKRFNFDFKAHEDKGSFYISVTKGSNVIEAIRDYILPDFYYKLNIKPEDCGRFYEDFDWYKEWQKSRLNLIHPLIEQKPYTLKYYRNLGVIEKKRYQKAVHYQVRARGFPWIVSTEDDLKNIYMKLQKDQASIKENFITAATSYNSIANSFMNHRYQLRVRGSASPYEVFHDRKLFKQVMDLQLNSGPHINNSNIRAAFCMYKGQGVGQFNTLYAKTLCDMYCPEKGFVLDPCSGFGSRLVGVIASGRSYTGIEPSVETIKGLIKIKKWLGFFNVSEIDLHEGCAEDFLYRQNYYDMALTSPPYFNKEEYSYDDRQSFIRYPYFDLWCVGFLRPLIHKVYGALKSNSVFILNIDDVDNKGLIEKSVAFAKEIGFHHEMSYYSTALKRPGSVLSTEPFLILRKV